MAVCGTQTSLAPCAVTRLQCFTPDGGFIRAFGGRGDAPGQFCFPVGLAAHADLLFVADGGNSA